jgi:hypothetical protein
MFDFLNQNPALIIPILALMIPIVGIIFGTVTSYLGRVRQAELEANLKHAMLERGMSADEIRMVIEASAHRKGKGCARYSEGRPEVV